MDHDEARQLDFFVCERLSDVRVQSRIRAPGITTVETQDPGQPYDSRILAKETVGWVKSATHHEFGTHTMAIDSVEGTELRSFRGASSKDEIVLTEGQLACFDAAQPKRLPLRDPMPCPFVLSVLTANGDFSVRII